MDATGKKDHIPCKFYYSGAGVGIYAIKNLHGYYISLAVTVLGVVYLVINALGFLSLSSKFEPIPDPFFTIMEVLSMVIALGMSLSLTALLVIQTTLHKKFFAFGAVACMYLATVVTSIVHFTRLSLRVNDVVELNNYKWLFSFEWPSVIYALDILAWDYFYGWAVLLAAFVFDWQGIGKVIKTLLTVSGVLSFLGLLGVPLGDMQIRNIGIVGYAVVAPAAFLCIAKHFKRSVRNKDFT